MVAPRGAQQHGCGRATGRRVWLSLGELGVGPFHRARYEIRRCDAVGKRVMHLADRRDSIRGQAFRVVQLP